MPLSAPPPLQPPTVPIVVRRAYRSAPAFEAGARRSVRLAVSAGQRIAVPCTGGVRFAGRVAGGPPVVSVDCDATGLRVTVGGITHALARGMIVRAGGVLGHAAGSRLGLSVRRAGVGYVDPLPLLAAVAPQHPTGIPSGRTPRARRPAPPVHGLRTLDPAVLPRGARAAHTPDVWLGACGIMLGAGAALAWVRRSRRMRVPPAPIPAPRAGRA